MKRVLSYLTIPALLLAAASCAPKEEIEFAHEAQAFETRSDRILVEAILPQATAADDEVYIIGEFNGGEAAVGNAAYRLTRSSVITAKWGVYLDPTAFQGGKSLADGFTFYNVQQGLERGPKNEDVLHTLTIGTGEWANVYADKWAKYFEPPTDPNAVDLPEHDGVRVYVINESGWGSSLTLYQWGDENNLGGGWPGMAISGSVTIAGQSYDYFEYGDEVVGLSQNLIFSNNGDSQLADYGLTFADGVKDYFLLVTPDGVSEAPNPAESASSDPRKAMTEASTWGVIGSIASTGNSWDADEPMFTDGTWHVCLALELTASDEFKFRRDGGWDVNFGGAFGAFGEPFSVTQDGANIKVTEDGTYDLFLNPETGTAIFVAAGAPVTLPSGDGGGEEPQPEVPNDPVTIYVQDLSGWEEIALYMYGDKELCGSWPGILPAEKTVKIGTVSYKVFTVADALGRAENLIFNNNGGGVQTADWEQVTLGSELFVKVAPGEEAMEISALDPRNPDIRILINNKTDWDEIALYAYGDAEAFGGWPGATPVGTETVKGVEYTVFGLPAGLAGKSLNLIFNNNNNGKQLDAFAITVPEEEIFLTVNAEYSLGGVEGNPRGEASTIYVVNKQGWETLNLYAWGDAEVFGGWAGAAGTKIGTWRGQPVYTYDVAADASGKKENLIFNNGDGAQFDAMSVTLGEDLYLEIENSKCTATEPATRVYVVDETGWDEIALYVWGTTEIFGGWPGAAPAGTEEIGGVTYKYFDVPASAFGGTANFILNNNNNGVQLENFDVLKGQTITRDFYFRFTADNVTVVE